MTTNIGGNLNTNDIGNAFGPITVTSAISVTILPPNPRRLRVFLFNTQQDVFIKFEPAGSTAQTGMFVLKKGEGKELFVGNDKYTGEISAISFVNGSGVFSTELYAGEF